MFPPDDVNPFSDIPQPLSDTPQPILL